MSLTTFRFHWWRFFAAQNSFSSVPDKHDYIMEKLNQPTNQVHHYKIMMHQVHYSWVLVQFVEVECPNKTESNQRRDQAHRHFELVYRNYREKSIYPCC